MDKIDDIGQLGVGVFLCQLFARVFSVKIHDFRSVVLKCLEEKIGDIKSVVLECLVDKTGDFRSVVC